MTKFIFERSTVIRPLRESLMKEQDGLCFWCMKPMLPVGVMLPGTKIYHPRSCTFDHLYEKGHPKREKYNGVAACFECNQLRRSEIRIKQAYWGA